MKLWLSFLLCVASFVGLGCRETAVATELSCSVPLEQDRDPNLKQMTYDIGYGKQTMWAYVEPDVGTMYRGKPPASTKGLFGSFPFVFYWFLFHHLSSLRHSKHFSLLLLSEKSGSEV